ncbi:hypothetical protein SS50377_20024 [Spironucleus salmonicida]|uniref:Uncharacterized protein n=1 Tax=Spironucleus salmonicida TaxID=348837 RepID=V6LXP6_9EUKA|nr:hypothetical protein SS50377_20024 [Spironucleus salmonicida]|eukprot:EST49407.1 Hypothetical protein SS50377_10332 [Spironucleus salmonicida]
MNLFVSDLKNSYRPLYKSNITSIQLTSIKQELKSVKIDLLQNHIEIIRKIENLEKSTSNFQPNKFNFQLQADFLEKEAIIQIMQDQIDSLQISNEILSDENNKFCESNLNSSALLQSMVIQQSTQKNQGYFEILAAQNQVEIQKAQTLEVKQYLLQKKPKNQKLALYREQQKKNEKILFQMKTLVQELKKEVYEKDEVINSLVTQSQNQSSTIKVKQGLQNLLVNISLINDTNKKSLLAQCQNIIQVLNLKQTQNTQVFE